ncbi:MAG: phosphoserine phosphatase SerB [Anaerolineales bacterium]|nr:phosphoserine phosphatase SerB [Anaerolineales bacterium]
MNSLYVISAIGRDRIGLVHSLTQILADLGINIVDVEARAIRGLFTTFLVVDISPCNCTVEDMKKALENCADDFDLGIRVEPYEAGRRKVTKKMMLLTVMGADRPGIVAETSNKLLKNNFNIESVKMIARGEYIAMEIIVDASDVEDMKGFRNRLIKFMDDTGLDISLRKYDVLQKPKRVVIFDVDSTIIREEVIDELAKVAGVGDDVQKMTERAMAGELEFKEAVRLRVSLLKGLTVEQLEMLTRGITLTPGAEELISTLRAMGYKVGVVSGGFTFFTDYLKKRLNLDYTFANELEIVDGIVTGNVKGDIIDAEGKGHIIEIIAESENISPDQIVAVGDGANDRFMLQNAGLGIGFSPKEILKEYSDGLISRKDLSGLRYFLGIPSEEVAQD